MIKIINDPEIIDIYKASSRYRGYYYLMLISDRNESGTIGTVLAISDQEGIDELTDMEDKLLAEGKEVLIGSGDDGKMEDLEIVGVEVYG